jgi:hypothetical protein
VKIFKRLLRCKEGEIIKEGRQSKTRSKEISIEVEALTSELHREDQFVIK